MTDLADLTPRQRAVAALIATARTDKYIAAELGMSGRRVRVHITSIAFLIHADPLCNTRVQIALWYRERASVILTGQQSAA